MEVQADRVLVKLSVLKATGMFGMIWGAIGWLWLQPFITSGSIEQFLASGSSSARGWPLAAIASLVLGLLTIRSMAKLLSFRGALLSVSGSFFLSPRFRQPVKVHSSSISLGYDRIGWPELTVFSGGVEQKVPLILAAGDPVANFERAVEARSGLNIPEGE